MLTVKPMPVRGEAKKVVPIFIKELLSPLALAVWVMGDGTKVSSG
jgi:hypothetical protein